MKTTKQYGKKVDLALSTWVKLSRAFSSFNKKSEESIRSFDLAQSQFAVIEMLGHLGQLKVGVICNKMLVSGGNITIVLDTLEKLGYIERIHCKEDRRAVNIALTSKGNEVFEKVFKVHAENISRYMNVLTPDEQKTLGDLLKKLGEEVSKL